MFNIVNIKSITSDFYSKSVFKKKNLSLVTSVNGIFGSLKCTMVTIERDL